MRIDNQPPGRGRRCDARLEISANSASDFARHAVAALCRLGFRRAVWSASVDGISSPTWHRWLGTRVAIWPFGPPREPLRSIVSSRLPRALDTCPQWFERLRRELFAAATNGQRIVCVDGTAIATFLRHASATLGVRLLDVRHELPWGDILSTTSASRFLDMAPLLSPSRDACTLWLTPCFPESNRVLVHPDVPLADRVSILLGATVTPLSVRPRGTIDRLLDARRSESTQPRSWRDAIAPQTVLLETPRSSVRPRQLVVEPLPWPALLHCVRRHDGPWADQSQAEFLDELLWELPDRDRSPLATLVRIVQEQRLRASSAAIRGGQPVVCFSARPLEQLATLRRYQRHRRRWDFEPYGLAIRREWLEAQGARPVRYGDDTLWESLADAERPWFQRQTTRARRSAPHPPTRSTLPATDWTVEDEWRAVGDVDLSTLSTDEAVLFVAEDRDADRLRPITRWPIVVLRAYTIGNPGD